MGGKNTTQQITLWKKMTTVLLGTNKGAQYGDRDSTGQPTCCLLKPIPSPACLLEREPRCSTVVGTIWAPDTLWFLCHLNVESLLTVPKLDMLQTGSQNGWDGPVPLKWIHLDVQTTKRAEQPPSLSLPILLSLQPAKRAITNTVQPNVHSLLWEVKTVISKQCCLLKWNSHMFNNKSGERFGKLPCQPTELFSWLGLLYQVHWHPSIRDALAVQIKLTLYSADVKPGSEDLKCRSAMGNCQWWLGQKGCYKKHGWR